MTTRLILGKDLNSNVTYQIPFTDTGVETTLAPGVAQSTVVPIGIRCAWFMYSTGANVFVDPVTTAVIPGASFAATTADLNPVARSVVPGSTLSFISDEACYVKVSYYQNEIVTTGLQT